MTAQPANLPAPPELAALPATGLAALLAAGEVSCAEVLEAHLRHIDAADALLGAFSALRDRDDLRAEATAMDAELRAGHRRGPLHGLPHAVKGLEPVAGLPWTQGSPVYADRVAGEDGPLAARLRAAGALIVGTTNTPEFGYGSQTYNPVHGTTRNPWDTTRTPGGSSGGAAAALAARLVPIADGTDYLGSLRNPAAFTSTVALRPTYRAAAAASFVAQLSVPGPMARTVEDLELLAPVVVAPEPAAPLGTAGGMRAGGDLGGARIAWVGDWGGRIATEPGVLAVCEGALAALREIGCRVEPVLPDFPLERLWELALTWRWWNALALAPLHDDPATRRLLKPEVRWEIEHGSRLSAREVTAACDGRMAWYRSVLALLDRYDVICAPSAQVFPFDAGLHWPMAIDGYPMDTYHRWMETVAPWSLAATPVLALPAGFDGRGLPTGVQLIGRPGADAALLRLGRRYERAAPWTARTPFG